VADDDWPKDYLQRFIRHGHAMCSEPWPSKSLTDLEGCV